MRGDRMPKPGWLTERESKSPVRFKRCINCDAGGDLCGQTNYIPKVGRLNMYRCRRHPTVVFYRETYACEDYHQRK